MGKEDESSGCGWLGEPEMPDQCVQGERLRRVSQPGCAVDRAACFLPSHRPPAWDCVATSIPVPMLAALATVPRILEDAGCGLPVSQGIRKESPSAFMTIIGHLLSRKLDLEFPFLHHPPEVSGSQRTVSPKHTAFSHTPDRLTGEGGGCDSPTTLF